MRAWADTQIADHLRRRRIHFLHMEKSSKERREPHLCAVGGDSGRCRTQEEGEDPGPGHTMVLCGAEAPRGRAPRGNLVRDRKKARERTESEFSIVSDGSNQPSTFAKRLLRRWRSRRQSVSETLRSKRVQELTASLIRATRGST